MASLSLLSLPIDDIIYTSIFPKLSVVDLINLKAALTDCGDIVHEYISKMTDIDWKNIPSTMMRDVIILTKNLKRVDFEKVEWVTDSDVREILRRNDKMEIIKLIGCNNLTKRALRSISHLQYVTELNLRKCYWVNDDLIFRLTSCLRPNQLKKIDFSECGINDHAMTPFFKKFKGLTEIAMESCPLMTNALLGKISSKCKELVILNVAWNVKVRYSSIRRVIRCCPKLRLVKFWNLKQIIGNTSQIIMYTGRSWGNFTSSMAYSILAGAGLIMAWGTTECLRLQHKRAS